MGLPSVVCLHFPADETYSPERSLRYLANPLWCYAEVEQARLQYVPEYGEQSLPLVFREIAIPQQQMYIQLLSGNVRLIYNDQVYAIRDVRQDSQFVLTISGAVDADFTPQTFRELSVGDLPLTVDGDTLGVVE